MGDKFVESSKTGQIFRRYKKKCQLHGLSTDWCVFVRGELSACFVRRSTSTARHNQGKAKRSSEKAHVPNPLHSPGTGRRPSLLFFDPSLVAVCHLSLSRYLYIIWFKLSKKRSKAKGATYVSVRFWPVSRMFRFDKQSSQLAFGDVVLVLWSAIVSLCKAGPADQRFDSASLLSSPVSRVMADQRRPHSPRWDQSTPNRWPIRR